jgi:anti-anti-sigma factor
MTEATVEAHTDDHTARIRLGGEIDIANCERVEREIVGAIANHVTVTVIELGDVEYLDSAGIRILSRLATRLRTLQIALEVDAPVGSLARRVIELTGLAGFVQIRPPLPGEPTATPSDS